MSNQWVVRALLSDACKLKNSESTSYRRHSFDFSKTYISRDMTRLEQAEHKRFILKLKDNNLKDGNTRWIIKFFFDLKPTVGLACASIKITIGTLTGIR